MSEERTNSALGLISMISTFSAWAILITIFIAVVYFEMTRPGGLDSIDEQSSTFYLIGVIFFGALILNFAGLIVGIVALFNRNQRKLFAVLGIIAGLSFIAFGALVIMLGATSG